MKNLVLPIIIILFVAAINSTYVVTEGRQSIITEFGKPIGKSKTKAGLYFKTPFIQKVIYVDKRILNWDGFPNQIPTKDKKYIKVDTTARWRIVDALKFIQTVQNLNGAKGRLDTIIDGATRDVVSNHKLVEVVRNSNDIIAVVKSRKESIRKLRAQNTTEVLEEVSGDIEKIVKGREKLSALIAKAADSELTALGIKLIDVQLKRISYEETVERKVYERMISERKKIAQKIRSIGQGEKAKIEGRLAKDLHAIEAGAYKKAQIIRGKLEAKAAKIYASALGKGEDFYQFQKTLELYRNSLGENTKVLLTTESEIFKYFKKSR